MKPIEPGCLVVLFKAANHAQHHIGHVFTVAGLQIDAANCKFCGGQRNWPLDDGGHACPCALIRIDDDPDAITEPVEQEIEA